MPNVEIKKDVLWKPVFRGFRIFYRALIRRNVTSIQLLRHGE